MDLSSQGLVETDDEVTECALSRTASSDNKGYFARWKEEVRFFEYFDRGVRGVCKAHLLKSVLVLASQKRTHILQLDVATAESGSQSASHGLDRATISHVTSNT